METIIIILNALFVFSIWITFYFLRGYLPSYLNKKGENLATKEDVSKITEKIEEVKLDFSSKSHILIKKREAYEKIASGMRVFIQGHPATGAEKNAMLEAYSIAWLWAADEVIRKLNEHLDLQIKRTEKPASVEQNELKRSYSECILEMRKDVGYQETSIKKEDFHFVSF